MVLLPHVVGDADTVLRKASSWPTITANTELIVAFGGIPAKNVFVTPGGITRHGTPGHLAMLAERNACPAVAGAWATPLGIREGRGADTNSRSCPAIVVCGWVVARG